MQDYFHSVQLDPDKCQGCVTCIRRCPTEAIRVRDGKATITKARCIDCGECIRACPTNAKSAFTDNLIDLSKYKYNIALPAPSLYAQFSPSVSIDKILESLTIIGFDDVFEVAIGAEIVSLAIKEYLKESLDIPKPLISTACPAIVRLIQVKYPELIENLTPFPAPLEIAANFARQEAVKKLKIDPKDIGTWFITPCPAKMTATKVPLGSETSEVSGTIAINRIYGELLNIINQKTTEPKRPFKKSSHIGIGWAVSGGESIAIEAGNNLVVSGMYNAINVFDQISLGKLADLDHIEVLACPGGCIGGVLTVENRHVAEHRLRQRLKDELEKAKVSPLVQKDYSKEIKTINKLSKIDANPSLALDQDISQAIHKLDVMDRTLKELPGLDCGSCGSPTCKTLAEDIVQNKASETDCIFILRKRVGELANRMVTLATKMPPPLDRK